MQNHPGAPPPLTAAQRLFVDDMGQLMVGWGLPRTTGRVYAHLLLQTGPVGLDRVCADLGVAASGASVATRQLVHFGMARATGAGGSRRLLYEALHDLEAIFAARNAQTRTLATGFRQGAAAAPPGHVRQHLEEMAAMLECLLAEVPALLARLRAGGQPR